MEEMMLLEEYNSVGTATLGTASVAGTMSVVMSMVMSMVVTTNWMWAMAPGRLMGPFMGINGCKVQRGEELGELQATITVFVCFGKELVYVVIDGHLRLQEDKWGQVSPTHSGGPGFPATPQLHHRALQFPSSLQRTSVWGGSMQGQHSFKKTPSTLPPLWEALGHPVPQGDQHPCKLSPAVGDPSCTALTGKVWVRKVLAVSFNSCVNSGLLRKSSRGFLMAYWW